MEIPTTAYRLYVWVQTIPIYSVIVLPVIYYIIFVDSVTVLID